MTVSTPHYLLFSESNTPRTAEASCARRGHASGRWRFVLETVDGRTRFEATDEELESEEGRLALLAVVRGLEALEQPSRVTVVTPSRYVSRGFLFGLEEWRENGWRWERFGEMTPIKNRDLWQRIDRAMQVSSGRVPGLAIRHAGYARTNPCGCALPGAGPALRPRSQAPQQAALTPASGEAQPARGRVLGANGPGPLAALPHSAARRFSVASRLAGR